MPQLPATLAITGHDQTLPVVNSLPSIYEAISPASAPREGMGELSCTMLIEEYRVRLIGVLK